VTDSIQALAVRIDNETQMLIEEGESISYPHRYLVGLLQSDYPEIADAMTRFFDAAKRIDCEVGHAGIG
jgi:hypothetical protein